MGTTRTLNSHWSGTGRSGREFFAYRRDRTRQLPLEVTLEVDWRVHICISNKIFGKVFGRVESTFYLRVISIIWEPGTGKSLSKNNASVNSTCAQAPPGQLRGICRLVSPGGGAFANFALPGGRAFANPRAIPELLTRTRFPISEYNYKEGFNGKNADWLICQWQE